MNDMDEKKFLQLCKDFLYKIYESGYDDGCEAHRESIRKFIENDMKEFQKLRDQK